MTFAVFDFVAIAKEAKLSDGRPQNVVQPLSVGVDPQSAITQPTEPQWFYGVAPDGVTHVPCEVNAQAVWKAVSDPFSGGDTAPSEWSAPDFDPA